MSERWKDGRGYILDWNWNPNANRCGDRLSGLSWMRFGGRDDDETSGGVIIEFGIE